MAFLQAFSVVFNNAIEKSVPADDVTLRVNNLIDCITYFVFVYTSRGLFECDKLIFASQMTFQVSIHTYHVVHLRDTYELIQFCHIF